MKKTKSNVMVKQAMIAAMYTVVGMVLAPFTFGAVQVRVSEALTLLPVFGFQNVWGITIGCFLTNLVGFATGANILGWLDIIFGTAATLIAGIMSYLLRNVRFKGLPVLSTIPPIIVNAIVIGYELCIMLNGKFNPIIFWTQALSVGAGQLVSCVVFGLVLVKAIEKNPKLCELITK